MNSPYTSPEFAVRPPWLAKHNLSVVATHNHSKNDFLDQEPRPMQLIIFTKPDMEMQYTQSHQSINIDLREKFLVWEEAESDGLIAYSIGEHSNLNLVDSGDLIRSDSCQVGCSEKVFSN